MFSCFRKEICIVIVCEMIATSMDRVLLQQYTMLLVGWFPIYLNLMQLT